MLLTRKSGRVAEDGVRTGQGASRGDSKWRIVRVALATVALLGMVQLVTGCSAPASTAPPVQSPPTSTSSPSASASASVSATAAVSSQATASANASGSTSGSTSGSASVATSTSTSKATDDPALAATALDAIKKVGGATAISKVSAKSDGSVVVFFAANKAGMGSLADAAAEAAATNIMNASSRVNHVSVVFKDGTPAGSFDR